MRVVTMLFVITSVVAWCNTTASAYTLTFDEFNSGTSLSNTFYREDYGATFDDGFKAVDHTTSTWGLPRSGTNVLIWDGGYGQGYLLFGQVTPSYWDQYSVFSVDAYFSTLSNAMVKITAYHFENDNPAIPVTSVIIGAASQSWDNQHVVIDSSNGVFEMLEFEGVNSPDDLRGFCADDMTVIPVPESSSLLALASCLLPVGVAVMRRRRSVG